MMADRIELSQDTSRTDNELVRHFVDDGSDPAFRELVGRHVGMVFGVAFRLSRNRELAEEATQNTFTILARKAGRLDSRLILAAWLHRVAWIETCELMRREHRRQQIMRTYAQNAPANEPSADSLGEALDILDQALAELPGPDRDVLLLRFHERLRLKQIADRLGITEEASRKRVERALARLSRFLGQRGVVVPSGVLAAGVNAAFGGVAPIGLASVVAEKAIASSLAAGGSWGTLSYLILMTQTKLKFICATALFLAGTASFLGGRHAAAQFGRAARDFAGLQGPMIGAGPAATTPSRPTASTGSPIQEASARQILENAVRVVREAENSSEAFYRAVLALRGLSSEDVPDVIGVLDEITDKRVVETLAPLVAGIWARTDPEAAVAWIEKRLGGTSQNRLGFAYQKILSTWAGNDPEKAYAWYSKKAASGANGVSIDSFRWYPIEIFSAWAQHDPWTALRTLAAVPIEDERAAISGIVQAHHQSPQPDVLRGFVNTMPETPRKAKLVEELASHWAKESPEAAAAWLDTVPMPDATSRFRAKSEVAQEWIKQDRAALLRVGAWVLTGAPTELRQEILGALKHEANRAPQESVTRQP